MDFRKRFGRQMQADKISFGKRLPECRGNLLRARSLADLTWLRTVGPADWFFQPADLDDLSGFLRHLDAAVPIFVMGVGSNIIVRDGGIAGIVIRLGGTFSKISIKGGLVRVGAAALDSRVAMRAAEAGCDLTFLRTIPGTIGGAVRMNAGCYGSYLADVCREITIVSRSGECSRIITGKEFFGYRCSQVPEAAVVVEAVLECERRDPEKLKSRMAGQIAQRDASQPTGVLTASSAFRNPVGYSSTGEADDDHSLKAWKLIEDAGLRRRRVGSAAISEKHSNFLVNLGDATATDVEALGELIRKTVRKNSGITLEWEIIRIGRKEIPAGDLPDRKNGQP